MNEIVEWKQANLEEYFTKNIDTMEKAVTVGLVIKGVGERCEIAIGKLANHVEKGKWNGGITAFAEGIGLPFSTVQEWAQATATPELTERSVILGTSKVAIVERAPDPELVWDWVDTQEEVPTVRKIRTKIEEVFKPDWDCRETKRQFLSKYGMTEDDAWHWVGFHWRSFTQTQLHKACLNWVRKQEGKPPVPLYQSPLIPGEPIEE